MKKILILLMLVSLFSCKKDEIPEPVKLKKNKRVSIYGTWVVVGGNMYFENMETRDKTMYSHFDANKKKSTLKLDPPFFDLSMVEVMKTTYVINEPNREPGFSNFILNGDSLNPYAFYQTAISWQLVEWPNTKKQMIGGSAIPLTFFEDYDGDTLTMNLKIYETYTVLDGFNYKYFSLLKLRRIK